MGYFDIIENEEYNKLLVDVFPDGYVFKEITVKTDFFQGDIVKFKDEYTAFESSDAYVSKEYSSWNQCDHSIEWKIDKIYVRYNENGVSEPYFGFVSATKSPDGQYRGWWIKGISSKYFDLVSHRDGGMDERILEQTFKLPYDFGTICWSFANHLFDSFTPTRLRVDGYVLNLSIDKTFTLNASCREWSKNRYKSTYDDMNFYDYNPCYQYSPIKKVPDKDYKNVIGYMPGIISIEILKEMFSNNTIFKCFAKHTWSKDGFNDAPFGKPVYEQLIRDINRTWEDLEKGASNNISKSAVIKSIINKESNIEISDPNKKKKSTSKKKPATKKSKVTDILAGLSEKEKMEMLKLLSQSK